MPNDKLESQESAAPVDSQSSTTFPPKELCDLLQGIKPAASRSDSANLAVPGLELYDSSTPESKATRETSGKSMNPPLDSNDRKPKDSQSKDDRAQKDSSSDRPTSADKPPEARVESEKERAERIKGEATEKEQAERIKGEATEKERIVKPGANVPAPESKTDGLKSEKKVEGVLTVRTYKGRPDGLTEVRDNAIHTAKSFSGRADGKESEYQYKGKNNPDEAHSLRTYKNRTDGLAEEVEDKLGVERKFDRRADGKDYEYEYKGKNGNYGLKKVEHFNQPGQVAEQRSGAETTRSLPNPNDSLAQEQREKSRKEHIAYETVRTKTKDNVAE